MLLILNDIGGFEILLILGFILVFFGSKSIPGLARTAGKTMRQIKEASADIQSEIKKSANDMKGDLDLKGLINDTVEDVKRPLDQYAQDIDHAVKYTPPNRRTAIKPAEDDVQDVASEEVVPEPQAAKVEKIQEPESKSETKEEEPLD